MSKLSRRSQQRLKSMLDSLDNINLLIGEIDREAIEDLVRRDAIPVGASSVSGSNLNFSRKGSGTVSSPVERTVLANTKKQPYDFVAEMMIKIERNIFDVEKKLEQIKQSFNSLERGEEKKRTRQTSTPCEICLVLPAAKAAMCIKDYEEWLQAGSPDRLRWKAFKLQMTSSEGKILVTEQPK